MGEIDFNEKGEGRRIKAATLLTIVYGSVFLLHLSSWGIRLIQAGIALMIVHFLRLFLARSQPPHASDRSIQEYRPKVSLVVAAKNEEQVIANLVKGLCQLEYDPELWELWVVDDNSSDRTPEILEQLKHKYPQLKTLNRGADSIGGKSGALNQVLPLTMGEIIGVFDADAQVSKDSLQKVVPLFARPRLGAVQLRKEIANADVNFWTRGQSTEMALDIWFQDRRAKVGGVGELRGNGQFVRRSALFSCGGWNEQTITDDLDLTLRLHLDKWDIRCLFHPTVSEEGVVGWWQLWHQRNRWAEGGYQRYLDYWSLIVRNRVGVVKSFDLLIFLVIQYILPTAVIPDLLTAYLLHQPPILMPLFSTSFTLFTLVMIMGNRQSYQLPWHRLIWHTILGSIYMTHWLFVVASVTHRMSIRAKRLKWVKTIHQGLSDSLAFDEYEEMESQSSKQS
jgi:1,2-diacylglycerol 3-beta-glucosyltransferase